MSVIYVYGKSNPLKMKIYFRMDKTSKRKIETDAFNLESDNQERKKLKIDTERIITETNYLKFDREEVKLYNKNVELLSKIKMDKFIREYANKFKNIEILGMRNCGMTEIPKELLFLMTSIFSKYKE